MAKFDFSSLPNELKCSVLDSVRFHDARELFRSAKSLRHNYLCRGLFPKRIRKLSMQFDFSTKEIRKFSIVFNEDEAISRVAKRRKEAIAQNEEFQRMILDLDIEDEKYQESLLSIVSTIRSCRTVGLTLGSFREHPLNERQVKAYLHHLFKEKKLLANIQRVASLEIREQHFIHFDKLSQYYNPIVDENVLFSECFLNNPNDFKISLDQNGFAHCKFFHFYGLPLNIESLAKTSGEFYTFLWHSFQFKHLDKAIRIFLTKAEIPGRNPKATVIFVEDQHRLKNKAYDDKSSLKFLFDLQEAERIDPKTGQIRPITEFETFEIDEEKDFGRYSRGAVEEEKESTLELTMAKQAIKNDSLLKQFRRIEEKIATTRFEHLDLCLKQKDFGYFRYRNLLLIARVCGDGHEVIQLQFIIESMPSDF